MITELQGQKLSPRDAEVLDGLWNGLSNKEIAKRMKIQARTVKHHIWRMGHQFRIDPERYSTRIRLCFLLGLEKGLISHRIVNVRFTEPVLHRVKLFQRKKQKSH